MSDKKEDLKELTLAITLLAGISAVLLKIVEYFSTNIIDLSSSALLSVYFLVFFLLLEILLIVCFLLIQGYLISIEEREKGKIDKIATLLHKLVFLVPIFALIYSFTTISYFFITKDWSFSESENNLFLSVFIIISFTISAYFLFDLKFLFSLTGIKDSSKNVYNKITKFRKNPRELEKITHDVLISNLLVIFFSIFLFIILVFGLFLVPTFLLCGSYSIEIMHSADSNSDLMLVAIKDTGIPSGKCFITLYGLNSSNKDLFQHREDIILDESVENSTDYMTGCKKDGIWYLLVDTSNLSTGYYCLHAEVTYNTIKNFDLLKARKCDNEIFYIS